MHWQTHREKVRKQQRDAIIQNRLRLAWKYARKWKSYALYRKLERKKQFDESGVALISHRIDPAKRACFGAMLDPKEPKIDTCNPRVSFLNVQSNQRQRPTPRPLPEDLFMDSTLVSGSCYNVGIGFDPSKMESRHFLRQTALESRPVFQQMIHPSALSIGSMQVNGPQLELSPYQKSTLLANLQCQPDQKQGIEMSKQEQKMIVQKEPEIERKQDIPDENVEIWDKNYCIEAVKRVQGEIQRLQKIWETHSRKEKLKIENDILQYNQQIKKIKDRLLQLASIS